MSRRKQLRPGLFEGRAAADEPHERTITRLNRSSGVRYEELHETLRRLVGVPHVTPAATPSGPLTSIPSATVVPATRQPLPVRRPGSGPVVAREAPPADERSPLALSRADQAWSALMEGNRRWAAGRERAPIRSTSHGRPGAREPAPFAIVVGCMDSRVPVELVFDVGQGDVVVVRTAGQAIDELVVASVDFAQRAFGTPLVVVLGHEQCAAARLAVRSLHDGETVAGAHDRAIVGALRPAYESARRGSSASPGVPLETLVSREQSRRVAQALRDEPWLGQRILKRELEIRSAYYELGSGLVRRLD